MNLRLVSCIETTADCDHWDISAESDPYIAGLLRNLETSNDRRQSSPASNAASMNPLRRDLCGSDHRVEPRVMGNPYNMPATPRSISDRRQSAGRRELW